MAAPTPVSAYLHSATMVKAGVFLLARLAPVLGGTAEWHYLLTLLGVTTMLLGALMALGQTDLKRLLGPGDRFPAPVLKFQGRRVRVQPAGLLLKPSRLWPAQTCCE